MCANRIFIFPSISLFLFRFVHLSPPLLRLFLSEFNVCMFSHSITHVTTTKFDFLLAKIATKRIKKNIIHNTKLTFIYAILRHSYISQSWPSYDVVGLPFHFFFISVAFGAIQLAAGSDWHIASAKTHIKKYIHTHDTHFIQIHPHATNKQQLDIRKFQTTSRCHQCCLTLLIKMANTCGRLCIRCTYLLVLKY